MVTKNKRWEVVKNNASPTRPFIKVRLHRHNSLATLMNLVISPILGGISNEHCKSKRGGGILQVHIYFPIGPRPSLVQKVRGGICLKYPLDPPMFCIVWSVSA